MKTRNLLLVLVILFVAACSAQPAATPTLFIFPTRTPTVPPSPSPVPPTATSTATPFPAPRVERVLIVSFDGMRPDAIYIAPMTNLLALLQTGAYTLSARTVFPSLTLPSHASMLTGMCPAKHGVTWNDYLPENGYALGPSLFDIAHAAGLRTVMVVGKEKLSQVTRPNSLDAFVLNEEGESDLAKAAVREMAAGFGVMFVHFPSPDTSGHAYGWLSNQQIQSLRASDAALGTILAALDSNGLRASTLIIVTADHGGHATTHGTDSPDDMTIPWIVNGPSVRPGPLAGFIHTTDTAATAASVLGLPPPISWDGQPVLEAFGGPVNFRPDPCGY